MLYLFYGGDQDRARAKWRQTLAVFRAKNPNGDIFRCDRDRFALPLLEELTAGAGLFNEKRLVAGDRLLENEEARSWFDQWLPAIVAAANTFVLLEEKLDAKLVGVIEKAGGKLSLAAAGRPGISGPNPFALTEAIGQRDRQRAWVLFQEALDRGETAEDLFWRLGWQVKTMLLVKKNDLSAKPTALTSLKPFVVQKTRRQVGCWREGELEKLSFDLIRLWHESRRGLADFELGLESLILSL